ncbi:hypothetical protein N0V94_003488 [Neodidymelliopsis sp. IMI 364377]|nr:hypothetical protein N0V94_003488 [Neodidymelliopsis sp. IMI 364377]
MRLPTPTILIALLATVARVACDDNPNTYVEIEKMSEYPCARKCLANSGCDLASRQRWEICGGFAVEYLEKCFWGNAAPCIVKECHVDDVQDIVQAKG